MGSAVSKDEDMNPMQVEQLVKDHQVELRATRGTARRRSTDRRGVARFSRTGVQAIGVGLVRVGLRLAGSDSRLPGPASGHAGFAQFRS
jgi:hypothetical protein